MLTKIPTKVLRNHAAQSAPLRLSYLIATPLTPPLHHPTKSPFDLCPPDVLQQLDFQILELNLAFTLDAVMNELITLFVKAQSYAHKKQK